MKSKSLLYMVYEAVWKGGRWVRHGTPVRQGVTGIPDDLVQLPPKQTEQSPDGGKPRGRPQSKQPLTRIRQVRLGEELFAAVREVVKANKHYRSVSHFIREALSEYRQGRALVGDPKSDHRKLTTLRFDETLSDFWDSLPKDERLALLEEMLLFKLGGGDTQATAVADLEAAAS